MSVVLRVTEYIVPAAVASLQFIVPFVVKKIVLLEKHSAQMRSQQIFLRVFILRLGFLMFTIFWTARTAKKVQGDPLETCVENQIGMLLYRFVETTMAVDIAMYVIIPQIRYCFTPNGCCWCLKHSKDRVSEKVVQDVRLSDLYGNDMMNETDPEEAIEHHLDAREAWKQEFDIPGVLVEEIYRQVVVWCGMYFCPMLPLLSAVTMMVGFYAKYLYLRQFCCRPREAVGIARNKKVFYGMLLLGVCVSFLGFRYLLSSTPICGPHKDVHVKTATMELLYKRMPGGFSVIENVFDPMLMSFVILLLGAYANYIAEKNTTYAAGYRFFQGLLKSECAQKRQLYHDWRDRMDKEDAE